MDRIATLVSCSSACPRSIGAVLIDAGRLSIFEAEQILRRQKEQGNRFGDAGIELGLLDAEDIRFALASQFEYPYLPAGDTRLSGELVAAYAPSSPVVEQMRALRSQLMLRWLDVESRRKALAIVSPKHGEGRSFIAANLAIVFSQLGERTLLIDADLRTPRQHQLFKLGERTGLSGLLSGRASFDAVTRIPALLGLSVLPAGVVPPNPQELLGRPAFNEVLKTLSRDYDVIIIDTPAASDCADALTVAALAGSALPIARNDHSSMSELAELASSLQQSGTLLVGSVLNDTRGNE
ncbi:MAG: chain length determinant protein tyrosine kinase EpsG [Propionivibrio sp.]|nr:chain length determinant protein tyrosine kinase EpsG [Propionivibrio sp.]MBK8400515.1 chain length determinant protein tyrosine kinase EpsG [Propionivibrio sp.]MBK8744413.1 chain length determinant protein tyrosine kinase EpsG [Propionivibrio sp.]MBK8895222.1 chain length determinant protein tyrosine kinase EpsG [Propionivibrio sp.]MBL0206874.1 chain length determinant protein tyrosine kinase EpsG [Propionivibrio sp.]